MNTYWNNILVTTVIFNGDLKSGLYWSHQSTFVAWIPILQFLNWRGQLEKYSWNLTESLEKIMKFHKALISWGTFWKNLRCNHDQQTSSTLQVVVMLCPIWYHFYNLKNKKISHGGTSLNKTATLLKITLLHWCFSFLKIVQVTNHSKLFSSKIYAIWIFECLRKYICLLQCLATCKSRYVYFAGSNKSMHIPKKACRFWMIFQHFIQLYSPIALALLVNMCLYSSLCHEGKSEEWRRTAHLLDSLIYLWSMWWQTICPWEVLGGWT